MKNFKIDLRKILILVCLVVYSINSFGYRDSLDSEPSSFITLVTLLGLAAVIILPIIGGLFFNKKKK